MRQSFVSGFSAFCLGMAAFFLPSAEAASRLKDITDVEGVRENQLIGYGLVVGLNGTGDSLRNSPFTRQSLEAMLERLGVNTRDQNLNTRNVAAVMVTANLPPFATNGSRMDVSVSSLGDASSLSGGILLVTPLLGADGQVYAVGQGPVAAGGFAASGDSGTSVIRNVPTIGRIPNGALIEREIGFNLANQSTLRLSLRNPDFTTSQRIAVAINAYMGMDLATAEDSGTVRIVRPPSMDMTTLITEIENLVVEPDQPARIVIDEASGVIVMGENVRVSTVAIAQGNLTIQISEQPAVSQPAPFSDGETTVVPQSGVEVLEDGTGLAMLEGGVPLRDLVDGLNALGVTPRDMISILQALKASGALQADIEVM
ncbi:MAG: flagellar basal body P-ring protein FlgI [Ponticaulis sp.]|nr:flagellar basal body P-ring protein FlgI [Ponticaulis sp.]MDF1681935.1 flagellar basal body P-ring protein FlgI [Ponticaulis sp.]